MRDQCLWELKRTWIRDHTREFPIDMLVEMVEVLQVCVERVPVRDMRDYLIDVVEEEEILGRDAFPEEVAAPEKVVSAEVEKDDGELDWSKAFPNGV